MVSGRPGAAGFTYADENGNVRVLVGNVELLTESTGAETRYPAAVVLCDAENKVIWQLSTRMKIEWCVFCKQAIVPDSRPV